MPGRPLAVGGPSRKVKGDSRFLLDSIDSENVASSPHDSIREFSNDTGSRFPGELGTTIGQATDEFVLNLRGKK